MLVTFLSVVGMSVKRKMSIISFVLVKHLNIYMGN